MKTLLWTLFGAFSLSGISNAQPRSACSLAAFSDLRDLNFRLSKTSGIPALDQAFNSEFVILQQRFGVNVDFYFLDDTNASNAYAIPQPTPRARDGIVAFGLELTSKEFRRDRSGLTVAAIMAHEFGHIAQFQRSLPVRGYVMELQADYLAGWYLQKRFGSYQDVESVLRSFYSIGNTDFTDSSSHPSPEMRVKAVLKGYQTGATDVQRAVRESLAYVTNEGTKVDDEGTISMTLSALGNDIRKAIAAADQYFASWKGENLETRWSSRVVLTGARDCSITDNTEDGERYASLRCRMQISEQQADHESAFAAYKKQISQALVGARFEDNSDGDAARWISESGLVSIRLRITRERVRRGDRTEGSLFSGSMITLDVSRFQTRQ